MVSGLHQSRLCLSMPSCKQEPHTQNSPLLCQFAQSAHILFLQSRHCTTSSMSCICPQRLHFTGSSISPSCIVFLSLSLVRTVRAVVKLVRSENATRLKFQTRYSASEPLARFIRQDTIKKSNLTRYISPVVSPDNLLLIDCRDAIFSIH